MGHDRLYLPLVFHFFRWWGQVTNLFTLWIGYVKFLTLQADLKISILSNFEI